MSVVAPIIVAFTYAVLVFLSVRYVGNIWVRGAEINERTE